MIFGIQKRQSIFLVLILSVPILLNSIAVWEYVGTDSIVEMWGGRYPHPLLGFLGGPYNPLPEIFLNLLITTVPLGLLTWLLVFISNKAFFQKQLFIAKVLEAAMMSSFIAIVFAVISGIVMPLVWLPIFRDGPTLGGIPGSVFMLNWSLWFVLPLTVIILFGAVIISKNKKIEPPLKATL